MKICPDCRERFDDGQDNCPTDAVELLELGKGKDERFGQEVAGRFLVLSSLGAGGMGMVYKAYQTSTARTVALKLLLPQVAENDDDIGKRFVREARVTAGLSSPHTVTVHDFGVLESGELYIAMELLKGQPLDEVIKHQGPLAPVRVKRMLQHICLSLEEAHNQGLVHRDLKPQNVFIDVLPNGNDFAKVLDFGVAKVLDEQQGQLTKTGATVGTPTFMSPEQAMANKPIGPGCDIYSAGVMMFQMLTNSVPFVAETAMQVMMMHVMEPPPTLESLGLTQSPFPEFDAVIQRCLQKEPEDRYSGAAALHAALDAIDTGSAAAASSPLSATVAGPAAIPGISQVQTVPAGAGAATQAGPAPAAKKSSRVVFVLAGVLLLLAAIAVPLIALGGGGDPPPRTEVAAAPAEEEAKKVSDAPPKKEAKEEPEKADAPPPAADEKASPATTATPPASAPAPAPPTSAPPASAPASAPPTTAPPASAPAPPTTTPPASAPAPPTTAPPATPPPPTTFEATPPKTPEPTTPKTPESTTPKTPKAPKKASAKVRGAKIVGTMQRASAKGAMRKVGKKAVACYNKAVPGSSGPMLTVNLFVRPSGSVSRVGVKGGAPAGAVKSCLAPTAKGVKFPSFTGAGFSIVRIRVGK